MLSAKKRADKLVQCYLSSAKTRKIIRKLINPMNSLHSIDCAKKDFERHFSDISISVNEFDWFVSAILYNQAYIRNPANNDISVFNSAGLKLGLDGMIVKLWKECDFPLPSGGFSFVSEFRKLWNKKEIRKPIFSCAHEQVNLNCNYCLQTKAYAFGLNGNLSMRKFYEDNNMFDELLVYLAGYDYYLEFNKKLSELEF